MLINDEAAAEVRPTFDVDAIAEITSYADYANFSERLRKLGFFEDTSEDAPSCMPSRSARSSTDTPYVSAIDGRRRRSTRWRLLIALKMAANLVSYFSIASGPA